jgi:hypothetical protein
LGRDKETAEGSADARANTTESPALPSSANTPASSANPPASSSPAPVPATDTNEFPSEFADYHRGALTYHAGEKDKAQTAWTTLLARPAAERKYRTTWAEYMLGKMAVAAGKSDEARAHFQKLRDSAKAGFTDSLGLAAASIGWEALLELNAGHLIEAARLYFQQLATGDPTAVNSLRLVTDQLAKQQPDLPSLLQDPLLQRLATACALSGIASFGQTSDTTRETVEEPWLATLEKADAKQVKDADCVAWMYYQKADYKGAARWLQLADAKSPYALWLKAKLALREGKLDAASHYLAEAVPKLPQTHSLESRTSEYEMLPGDSSKGDLGCVYVGRADFLAALKQFSEVNGSDDDMYLAEGVLTVPELTSFIEHQIPESAEPEKKQISYERYPNPDERAALRAVVGRRLARAGKLAQARPYFADDDQKVLDQYADLLKSANDAHANKAGRAEAFWKAANLVSDKGEALFDYGLPAEMAERLSGRTIELGEYPETTMSYGKPEKLTPPVTEKERARLRETSKPALRRRYSIYLAADLGWRAAALLPDNDEHTAEVLNTAGSWLKNRDEKAADRFYQAIERRCSKTELGKEAVKRHWFVELPEKVSDTESPETTPTPGGQ